MREETLQMELIMLGTGDRLSKRYGNNNALFNLNGYRLLVDCGTTAHSSLHQMGLSWDTEVDGVLVTHLHSDHVGGLEEVALDGKYKYKKKIELFGTAELLQQLWEHCLKGGIGNSGFDSLDDYFHVRPLSEKPFHIGGTPLQLIRSRHVPGKISYALLIGGIFYSSDMQFDERLLMSLSDRVARILHDCSLKPSPNHASLDQLLQLPRELQRKIWIMHYGDDLSLFVEDNRIGSLNVLERHKKYELASFT